MTYSFIAPEASRLGCTGLALRDKLHRFAMQVVRDINSHINSHSAVVVTGMQYGWDMEVAASAVKLHIPTVAVVLGGQERELSRPAQVEYWRLMDEATIITVNKPRYYPYRRRQLNEWMVDNSERLYALWDGEHGDVRDCVRYAEYEDVEVVNLWEQWVHLDSYRQPHRVSGTAAAHP